MASYPAMCLSFLVYLHRVNVEKLSESMQCLKACLACSNYSTTTCATIVIITNIVPSAAQTQIGFCFSKVMLSKKYFFFSHWSFPDWPGRAPVMSVTNVIGHQLQQCRHRAPRLTLVAPACLCYIFVLHL